MATNYVQEGDTVTLTAPYDRTSGQGALVGSLFGIALAAVSNAAEGEFATEGVWDVTALSTATFAQGGKVYWDDSNKRCDDASTGNTYIGLAVTAKTNGQTTVRVKLLPGVGA